jgi:hypothetical protein
MVMKKKKKTPPQVIENLGKALIDLGKLTFGSFILGGILRGEIPQYLILVTGAILSIVFVGLGLWFIAKIKE